MMTEQFKIEKDRIELVKKPARKVQKIDVDKSFKNNHVFLQKYACVQLKGVPYCRQCKVMESQRQYKSQLPTCRFYHYRNLVRKNGRPTVAGFRKLSDGQKTGNKLLQFGKCFNPKFKRVQDAKQVIISTAGLFCQMVKDEHKFAHLHKDKPITWKQAVKGFRELCDVCQTTIFNIHLVCPECGFLVCNDCFELRRTLPEEINNVDDEMDEEENKNNNIDDDGWNIEVNLCPIDDDSWAKEDMEANKQNSKVNEEKNDDKKMNQESYDEFQWLLCHNNKKHQLRKFQMAQFVDNQVIDQMTHELHSLKQTLNFKCQCDQVFDELTKIEEKGKAKLKMKLFQQIEVDVPQKPIVRQRNGKQSSINSTNSKNNINLSKQFLNVPHQRYCDGRLLSLLDPKNRNNLTVFQSHWISGEPLIVQNIDKHLDYSIWHPDSFNEEFGQKKSNLVNCMTGNELSRITMKEFWDGFEDVSKRLVDTQNGQDMLLKLKDWPPNAEFRKLMPKRFNDLMNALPIPEYTRYDGPFNLASHLPEFYVKPDLGPKMYCAYGSVRYAQKGTTNLHLDISDAINVMIYVGIAIDETSTIEKWKIQAIKAIEQAGCDQVMKNRVKSDVNCNVGAIWHIFQPQDADKIRELLRKVDMEKGNSINEKTDPIHDQTWYLDDKLRQRLLKEYNVKGYAIAQCLGDAVFIPAGAPHQVRNLNSCIKVAGEFVSPENVERCLMLTHEFRRLSNMHLNHEDKLQIKNIVYHSVKDAISILKNDQRKFFV